MGEDGQVPVQKATCICDALHFRVFGRKFPPTALIEITCQRCRYIVWTYGLDRAYAEKNLRVLQCIDLDKGQVSLDRVKILRRTGDHWTEFPESKELLLESLATWKAARRRANAAAKN